MHTDKEERTIASKWLAFPVLRNVVVAGGRMRGWVPAQEVSGLARVVMSQRITKPSDRVHAGRVDNVCLVVNL